MEDNMLTNAELDVSTEAVEQYRALAYEYLEAIQATLEVIQAGEDDDGDAIFGICLHCNDGHKEWYDPTCEDDDSMAGWNDKEEAITVLECKVLPNLGYTIHCRELREFHRSLA